MEKLLERVINENKKGLFLLDPPTGFGKTTAVVEIIRRFLNGDPIFSTTKKIFFVTNLITNLPYANLLEQLTDEEKKQCFQAKATTDYVIEKLLEVDNIPNEISSCKEYKRLKDEIDSYHILKKIIEARSDNNEKLKNNLSIIYQKIATDTEPAFRQYIKNKFFHNKSRIEKNKFIKENGWLSFLYPIINIDKYKVIFLTTQKFVLPVDTFAKMPFYLYCDEITKNSIVFMDEFDSTKAIVLDQIIDDGLKNQIDILSLFLDLHFALQNLQIPKKLLNTSEYHKKKVEEDGWHETEWHFNFWKERFNQLYQKYNLEYLIKSVGFQYDRAFIFDDGKYFNVFKDNSKEKIIVNLNKEEKIIELRGVNYSGSDKAQQARYLILDLEQCIDGFTKALFYVYNNYWFYKNQGKKTHETKYTREEAIYTVLDVLNLSEVQKDFLFNKIQKGDFSSDSFEVSQDIRRGFNYTEIEDNEYHDAKSVIHNFNFSTTPEDIILKLCEQSLLIGISATANIKTCIGNYDIDYIANKLGQNMIKASSEDDARIAESFESINKTTFGKYNIHPEIIDDYNCFSDREKCVEIINEIFNNDNSKKFLDLLSNKIDPYYYFIELKLAKVYKKMCENYIKSCIAFVNSFPKIDWKFNLGRLKELFKAIGEQEGVSPPKYEIVRSADFDEKFKKVKTYLSQGESVLIITTYQTIGSGKNIQYEIGSVDLDRVIFDDSDQYKTKDFEAVFLCTPTYLIQRLSFESEDKYADLARFLFHQEYLYKNKHLSYSHMKSNIANGFKQTFFSEKGNYFYQNGDMFLHTLKIAIQAVGRICRCRNKNKNIYVFSDRELVERIQYAYQKQPPKLMNYEFKALLDLRVDNGVIPERIEKYSKQNKNAYFTIKRAAYTVRNSVSAVSDWQEIRDFVLKNPTTNNPGKYESLYFCFDDRYSGYTYKKDSNYNITNIKTDIRYEGQQVSDLEAELPILLSNDLIKELFKEKGYAMTFMRAKYIMSQSLFQQVYLGALGEVVGKRIVEKMMGDDLQEITDYSLYELFDYRYGDYYFDFKHWNIFVKDNDAYVKKIEDKLKRVGGKKAIIINIIKRNEANVKINVEETVVQIPFLLDPDSGAINEDAINWLEGICF